MIRLLLPAVTVALLGVVACGETQAPSAPAQSPMSPLIDLFELDSYERIDPDADPKGGPPVYITAQDIVVRATVRQVRRVDFVLYIGNAAPEVDFVSVVPDATGNVEARLHLPETGIPYAVEARGVLEEGVPPQHEEGVGDSDERLITVGWLKVMAERLPLPP
jgi:hypothetical protein